jgi:hypothetical protein
MFDTPTKDPQSKAKEARRQKGAISFFPWLRALFATVAVGLLWYYLALVAPEKLPHPPGIKSPIPQVMPAFEAVCGFCASHLFGSGLIAAGVIAVGFVARVTAPRYYVGISILSLALLAFSYYAVSAPVENLIRAVEDKLPEERKFNYR